MAKWDMKTGQMFADTAAVEDYLESYSNDFNWFQAQCKKTATYPEDQALQYLSLGLVGEAGEVAEKFKKAIRDKGAINQIDDEAVILEVFDVMWYCAMLADELGYDLMEVVARGINKLNSRQKRNVISGSGDNR